MFTGSLLPLLGQLSHQYRFNSTCVFPAELKGHFLANGVCLVVMEMAQLSSYMWKLFHMTKGGHMLGEVVFVVKCEYPP